jgi:hypothetical protein
MGGIVQFMKLISLVVLLASLGACVKPEDGSATVARTLMATPGAADPGDAEAVTPRDQYFTTCGFYPEQCGAVPDDYSCDEDCDGVLREVWVAPVVTIDNCAQVYNPDQADSDGSCSYFRGVGIIQTECGDVCDQCPLDPADDIDKDGLCGNVDNCPHVPNAGQTNADGDAFGDACDELPNTANSEATLADHEARLDAIEAALIMGEE